MYFFLSLSTPHSKNKMKKKKRVKGSNKQYTENNRLFALERS